MIAEFSIENFFSVKSVQKISFEPSSDTFMSDEYLYEVKEGIRLLNDVLNRDGRIIRVGK